MVDFIGIGAQKAGTSWIYACLYEHPEICAPIKELHFFSRPRFAQGRAWYESHFKNCDAKKQVGEFSTSYLYSPEAAERIAALYPKVKIIAVLRNPVERAYSQYRNAIKAGEISESVSFADYQQNEPSVIEQGLYASQLQRYVDRFAKEQLLVLVYEDIAKDPAAFMQRVYRFLGVDDSFVPSMLHERVNVARTPRSVGVERLMHKVAEWLRHHGLDKLVWAVRRSGAPDWLRSFNTKPAEVNTDFDHNELKPFFTADAAATGTLIGRDLVSEWDL